MLIESRGFVLVWTCRAYKKEQMTIIARETNVDIIRSVSRPGTNFLDRVKKACSARSLKLKYANLSASIQNSGGK